MLIQARRLPSESIGGAFNPLSFTEDLERVEPATGKSAGGADMADHMIRYIEDHGQALCREMGDDLMRGDFVHSADYAKSFSKTQANTSDLCQISWPRTIPNMESAPKPFADIADRLRWHRESLGLSQDEYAAKIGFKRSAYSLWEAGSHRLSLDGALALRNKWGLSLDFMYEGIADALPMTLRQAWIERPAVSASRKSIVKPLS